MTEKKRGRKPGTPKTGGTVKGSKRTDRTAMFFARVTEIEKTGLTKFLKNLRSTEEK